MWYSEDMQIRIIQPLQRLTEQKTKWSYEDSTWVQHGALNTDRLSLFRTVSYDLESSNLMYRKLLMLKTKCQKYKGMGHEVFPQGLFFCDIAIWLKSGKFKQRRDSLSTFPFVLSMQSFRDGWCHQDLTLGEMRDPVDQIPFIPNLQRKYFWLTFPIVIIATSWEGFLQVFFTKSPPFFVC